ncbi:PAS domain-containing protein [Limimaricola sp.]|uniref:PAS domain-containing protein n=1 Tax=Limimaricola sp. TaxID=2211665 RepID=UPI0025B7C767|nr:PAS domain-containing protein [Limimaricola sp.]
MTSDDQSFSRPDGSLPGTPPMLAALEHYWRDLRGAQRLPVRRAVDPGRIDAALPHAFILERIAPGVARFRVTGQKINEMLGLDGRGMLFDALFADATAPAAAQWADQAFATPAIVELALLTPRRLLAERHEARLLLLPLTGRDGTVSRALGAIEGTKAESVGMRRWMIDPLPVRVTELGPARPRLIAVRSGITKKTRRGARPALRLVISND